MKPPPKPGTKLPAALKLSDRPRCCFGSIKSILSYLSEWVWEEEETIDALKRSYRLEILWVEFGYVSRFKY